MDTVAAVERCRQGDVSAFDALYREHRGAVVALARAKGCGPLQVDEVVQESFVRALEHLDDLREPDRFRPWLLAIARHVVTDAQRHRARHEPLGPDDEPVADGHDPDDRPELAAELHELSGQLRSAVSDLSPRDATIISLVARFQLPPADLGAVLGISPGAAKVALHRARQRLRRAVRLQRVVEGADVEGFAHAR